MGKKSNPFRALQFRNFRFLLGGQFVSQIGTQMQVVAIAWHIYSLTKSPVSLGMIGLVGFISIVCVSQFAGILADTYDRKKILILTQTILGIAACTLGVTTSLHIVTPLIIYLILGVNSAVSTFDSPARQAMLPNIIPPNYFMGAVSLNTTMRKTAIIVGQTIAGFIIALYGVQYIYFFNAFSFVVAVLTLFPITLPKQHPLKKSNTFSFRAILEGINFVRRTPIIYSTMLLDFLATFFSSATVLLPIFAQGILQVGPQGLGVLYAAESVGGIIAGMLIAGIGKITHQGRVIILSVICYGLATIGFGLSRTLFLATFFLALLGAGDMVSTIIRNTIRQMATPDYLRGRMISVNMIFFMGGPMLGDTEAGLLAAVVTAPVSVVIGGIGTIVATGLLTMWKKELWQYIGEDITV